MTSTRRGERARKTAALWLLAGLLAWPGEARAGDSWSTPFPGVRRLHRTTSKPLRIHALVVDLCKAGVDVRATTSGERKQTVPSFGAAVGAVAAVNGDFFSFSTYGTGGLAVGNGKKWPDTVDGNGEGLIAFGPERVRIDPPSLKLAAPLPWMREVVGGKPKIVVDGTVVTGFTNDLCTVRHPRTAAGVSRDRRTLFLVSDASGWWRYDNYSTIRLADLDGDGDLDLCARANSGMLCWPWTGKGFGPSITGPGLADANGWSDPPNFRTIRIVDVSGDGKADLCARAGVGIQCWLSTGGGFGPKIDGPAWSDAAGWAEQARYGTIRLVGKRCTPKPEVCDGKDNDCDGAVDEDAGCQAPPDLGPDDPRDAGALPDAAVEADGGPGSDGSWSWDDPPATEEQGGCSCDLGVLPGSGGLGSAALLALALLALARGRGRRGRDRR